MAKTKKINRIYFAYFYGLDKIIKEGKFIARSDPEAIKKGKELFFRISEIKKEILNQKITIYKNETDFNF